MIPNLDGLFIGLNFFLPLLVGTVSFFIDATYRRRLFVCMIILLLLVGSLGFILGEVDVESSILFLGESITFSISFTSIIIYQLSLAIFLIMVLFSSDSPGQLPTGFQTFLLSTSISFGFIAFISGQFMIRYIALDIVGLIAAAIVIRSFDDRVGLRRSSIIFSVLRFGDLCLLSSILLLYHHAGTVDISQMIDISRTLPSEAQNWVFGGFFIAVLIKTATWPFSFWMYHARQGTKDPKFWISTILMPGLGYYLLYRIQPMLVFNELFSDVILFFSGGILILMILLDIIDHQRYAPIMDSGGLFGSFLFIAAAFGPKDQLKYFVVCVLLYRFILYLNDEHTSPAFRIFLVFFPLVINLLYIGVNFSIFTPFLILGWLSLSITFVIWRYWREIHKELEESGGLVNERNGIGNNYPGGLINRSAQWLNRNVEIGLFTDGVYRLSGLLKEFAVWLNEKVETDILTGGFYRLSDGLVNSSNWVSEKVEQSIEGLYSWIGKSLMTVSEGTLLKLEVGSAQKSEEFLESSLDSLEHYEQNVLKKNLRLDLAWIPLFLIVIIVLILVV